MAAFPAMDGFNLGATLRFSPALGESNMRRTTTLATVFCLAITLTYAGTLPAADIFNNFGPGDTFKGSGLILQGEAVGNIGNVDQAAAFSTGPTDVAVTDIRLGIYVSSPDNSPFDGRGP